MTAWDCTHALIFSLDLLIASDLGATLTCPKCGIKEDGRPSCCAGDGAWKGKCGDEDTGKEYTWGEGFKACKCECTALSLIMWGGTPHQSHLISLHHTCKQHIFPPMTPRMCSRNVLRVVRAKTGERVVALVVVLGSGNVAMMMTRRTRGLRACWPADVRVHATAQNCSSHNNNSDSIDCLLTYDPLSHRHHQTSFTPLRS